MIPLQGTAFQLASDWILRYHFFAAIPPDDFTMAQSLRDWYLARLRSAAASRSGRTPMGLVAQDNLMLQQYVLDASKDRSAQKQQYFDALNSKNKLAVDYTIMLLIFAGISILLFLAFVSS